MSNIKARREDSRLEEFLKFMDNISPYYCPKGLEKSRSDLSAPDAFLALIAKLLV